MSAKHLPWFRFYTEAIDDEKLGLLAFEDRWHFVALLCLKGKGVLDDEPDAEMLARKVALKMGLTLAELEKVAGRLARMGLIDKDTFQPRAWDDRQMKSDSSAERVKAFRERKKQAKQAGNVTVTAQEEDTDTDKDKEDSYESLSPGFPDDDAAKPEKKNEAVKTAKPSAVSKPDEVDDQVWADFLQLRKAKRSPLTATALAGIEREAAKAGIGLQEALAVCCESGWAGFKAEWLQGRQSSAQRAQVGQPQSFAQQDREAGWARWEEMTGRVHPDRAAAQQMRPVQDFVIDASAGLVAGSAVFPALEG